MLVKEKAEAFQYASAFTMFCSASINDPIFNPRPSPQGVHGTPNATISILAFRVPDSIISTTCALRKWLGKIFR